MAKQTQKQEPELTMEDLYNLTMVNIEPELTTYNIGDLDKKYKNEKPEHRKERLKFYKFAMEKCVERMEGALSMWKDGLRDFEKMIFEGVESIIQEEEQDKMSDIEGSISKS